MRHGLVVSFMSRRSFGMFVRVFTASAFFCTSALANEKLSDPTKPYTYSAPAYTAKATNKPITLNYIKQSNGQAVAYLNGQPVTQGDTFRGMKVNKITSKGVELRSSKKTLWVPLHKSTGITKK